MRRAVFALGGVVIVASCGNGEHRLSKDEYARRADAICTRYNQETAALGTPGTGLKRLARYADASLPVLERATRQLQRLKPPKDEQVLARRWLSSLATLRADVVKIRETALANDLAGVRALATAAQRHDEASNRLARRLGAIVCSAG